MDKELQAELRILGLLPLFPTMTGLAMGFGISIMGFVAVGISIFMVVVIRVNYAKLHGRTGRPQDQDDPPIGQGRRHE